MNTQGNLSASPTTIGFIGGGNMAYAMIGGLIDRGFAPGAVRVAEPQPEARQRLRALSDALVVVNDLSDLDPQCDALILAVKPQILHGVCAALKEHLPPSSPLIVSIAAGVRARDIDRWLGGQAAVVRAMPNQGALLGVGTTALYALAHCSEPQRALAADIVSAVGSAIWVDSEHAIDAVTAISGSGPAYFFLLIEMLMRGAQQFGLGASQAQQLAVETANAAAALASQPGVDVTALRANVTSPGGTTAAAIERLITGDIETLFFSALDAARQRASEMADAAAKE